MIERFIALPCWATIAGSGTGSMVNLIFGPKILRDKPLKSSKLSDAYRLNRSDYSIFIQLSSWVLEKGDEEICSCESDNSNDGPMVMGLSQLLGVHVHYVEYIAKQGLYIDFQNDYTLSVFFDAREIYGEDSDNLTIFCPENSVSINSEMEPEFS